MAKLFGALVGILFLGISTRPAPALPALGEPGVLASNAATDVSTGSYPEPTDRDPSVGTDGAGNFIAVWTSEDDDLGDPVGAEGVAYSRSTDGGRTWSNTALIAVPPVNARGIWADLGYAPTGTWLAAWMSGTSAKVARSMDAGATWSAPIQVDNSGLDTGGALSIAGDSSGTWVLVWRNRPLMGGGDQLYYSRSTDDGLSWSPEASFPNAMIASQLGFHEPELATDGSGTWIAVWDTFNYGLESTRSTDGGATWSLPASVEASNLELGQDLGLAPNGDGQWMVSWSASLAGETLASLSIDDGLSWGPAQVVGGSPSPELDGGRLESRVLFVDGVWQMFWLEGLGLPAYGVGREGDLVGARSFDGTVWTDTFALNVNAGKDNAPTLEVNHDHSGVMASGADGSSVMVYLVENGFGGAFGTDSDVFFSRSDDLCPSIPSPTCSQGTQPESSRLSYRNPFGTRDRFKWTWRRGATTLFADFGDPTTTTDYALCIYDKAGGALRDVMEAHALSGGTCKNGPCWSVDVDEEIVRYKDDDGRRGSIRSIRLEAGDAGAASIRVNATGPALAPAPMPMAMDPSVRVQLVNVENGKCWEAVFSTSDSNTGEEFRALSD